MQRKLINSIMSVLILTIVFSCTTISESENIFIRKSPVSSIEVKSVQDNKINFIANVSWPDGCGIFSHFESYQKGDTVFISVFGKAPQNAICTQALINIPSPVEIKLSKPGNYVFSFWQSDKSTLDTLISIP